MAGIVPLRLYREAGLLGLASVSFHLFQCPVFAGDSDAPTLFDLWHARRLAWRRHHEEGAYANDITIAKWPQMDYWLKPVLGVPAAEAADALEQARQLSLA